MEFPLGRHDLGVGARDLDTGEQASLVVSLDDISAVHLAGTYTTVIWALWTWETASGPAVWLVEHVEEGVFLLETEPWLVRLVSLHELGGLVAVVELVWGSIWIPALGDDQDVWCTTEWIWVEGDRSEVDIGVVAGGLSGGGTVKVPFWEILDLELAVGWNLGQSLEGQV